MVALTDVPKGWMTAEAALARLSIARQTLYAYVSRGLVRTRPAPGTGQRNLYDQRSIEALLQRRTRSRARQAVAASTIDFGEPVLESSITTIIDGTLLYRGRDGVALAESATLEDVARLLWDAPAYPAVPQSDYTPGEPASPIARCVRDVAGLTGPVIWGRHAAALHADGAALLARMAETACNARTTGTVHETLAAAWGVEAAGAGLIRQALVLCADHELNASTFAVRVVASTGAALPACLLGGLAALSGPLHGGMSERVSAFLAEPAMQAAPRTAIKARLDRGDYLPGFGQRLYPQGDPRAAALLASLDLGPWWHEVLATVEELTGARPNLDMALAALERKLRLPPGSALAVFAVGRTVGWIAHALEQSRDGRLIRPRASHPDQRSNRGHL
jgi:citrate synthase